MVGKCIRCAEPEVVIMTQGEKDTLCPCDCFEKLGDGSYVIRLDCGHLAHYECMFDILDQKLKEDVKTMHDCCLRCCVKGC